jgi:tetratricopeptide (TPR) repeat protein
MDNILLQKGPPMPANTPDSDDFFDHVSTAMELANAGRHEEAVHAFHKAIQSDPTQSEPHFFLGQSLNMLERYGEAVKAFTKAAELDPSDSDALVGMGFAHYMMEEPGRAIEVLEKAVAVDADNEEAHLRLGDLYADGERWDEAAASYGRALKLDPEMDEAALGRAIALGNLDRFEEADAGLKELLGKHFGAADTHIGVGSAYLSLGHPEEAVMPLERARTLEPENLLATFALTRAYTELGRLTEAETLCLQVIEEHPESEDAHYLLTLIYLGMAESDKAVKELETLAKLNPELASDLLMQLMNPGPEE